MMQKQILVIKLLARRDRDGYISDKMFNFRFIHHDSNKLCPFCDLLVDSDEQAVLEAESKRPRPGKKKRVMHSQSQGPSGKKVKAECEDSGRDSFYSTSPDYSPQYSPATDSDTDPMVVVKNSRAAEEMEGGLVRFLYNTDVEQTISNKEFVEILGMNKEQEFVLCSSQDEELFSSEDLMETLDMEELLNMEENPVQQNTIDTTNNSMEHKYTITDMEDKDSNNMMITGKDLMVSQTSHHHQVRNCLPVLLQPRARNPTYTTSQAEPYIQNIIQRDNASSQKKHQTDSSMKQIMDKLSHTEITEEKNPCLDEHNKNAQVVKNMENDKNAQVVKKMEDDKSLFDNISLTLMVIVFLLVLLVSRSVLTLLFPPSPTLTTFTIIIAITLSLFLGSNIK